MHTMYLWLWWLTLALPVIAAGCAPQNVSDKCNWNTGWGTSRSETSPRTDL